MPVLAHKIRMRPTAEQAAQFRRTCGTARFVFNWGLAEWQRQYAEGEKPTARALKAKFNEVYPDQFPWVSAAPRDARSQPFANLSKAFSRFFKGAAGYPRFKKKGKSRDAFYVANDRFRVEGKIAVLPKVGAVRLTEALRFDGRILAGNVSREADRWFLSVQVEIADDYRHPHAALPKLRRAVGVDLGVATLATLSTGTKIAGPKALRKALPRLQLLSRRVARKAKAGKNRRKAVTRLAKQYAKVRDARKDALHKLTSVLCRENQAVCIEDLNVKGMIKNRSLSKALGDQSFGEFRRQLEYKRALFGCDLVIASRWFPSSKTCSGCGAKVASLPLNVREWACKVCGCIHDRDINAAQNLAQLINTQGYWGINACGQEGSGDARKGALKPAWAKQELAREQTLPARKVAG